MTQKPAANPLIDQLAAEVRKRGRGKTLDIVHDVANDFRRDLAGFDEESVGAALLRACSTARSLGLALAPGADAAESIANLLGAVGEKLYHHPRSRAPMPHDEQAGS